MPTASSPAARPPAWPSPGPGSTNLLTGLYDAKVDGAPVIALSGQVPSSVLGKGAFQDLDLNAAFRDVSVSTATLHHSSDHAELVAAAVKHALDGRGVAHLVLPDEVQVLPSEAPAAEPDGRLADRRTPPAAEAVDGGGRPGPGGARGRSSSPATAPGGRCRS